MDFKRRSNVLKLKKKINEFENLLRKKEVEHKKFTESFVANIAHEFRTPLNSINGFSQLIQKKKTNDFKNEKYINKINDSTERLLLLIDNLIELSYLQSNKMTLKHEEHKISEILKSALYYANHLKEKHKKDRLVIYEVSNGFNKKDEEVVLLDSYRLLIVLKNLLNNAIKFTKEGAIEIGCELRNLNIEFYVKDNGKGIQENELEIFKEFQTNESDYLKGNGGLGIGLSVCKGIIETMGGKIWYSPNKPKGSVFRFTIPYRRLNSNVNKPHLSRVYVG